MVGPGGRSSDSKTKGKMEVFKKAVLDCCRILSSQKTVDSNMEIMLTGSALQLG